MAFSSVAGGLRAGAADDVLVLGDVGEVREIAEGPDDGDGLVGVEAEQDLLELAPRTLVDLAMETGGDAPDGLDQIVDRVAFLIAQRIAEHPAQHANVVTQGVVDLRVDLRLGIRLCEAKGK